MIIARICDKYLLANMLHLITCDVDLIAVLFDNCWSFRGDIHIKRVSDESCLYTSDGKGYTNIFVVLTFDKRFLGILTGLCRSFRCHLSKPMSYRTVSLYRFNGYKADECYKKILKSNEGINYHIVNDIVTFCRICPQCDFGTSLIWIESDKETTFSSEFLMNFQPLFTM